MPDQPINVLQYPQDLTGELESNLVHEEVTLSAVNRGEFNIIIPRCAPFFHESVKLVKRGTNDVLVFGKDYYIGGIFEGITPYTKYNLNVGSIIILLDHDTGGNYTLEYQTLGGDYILDETRFIQLLKNKILNPVMVRWEDIHDKPIVFPPEPHAHTPNDTTSYEAFIAELNRLVLSIEKMANDDKRNTPSYNQMLVTLIEQGLILEEMANRLTKLQRDINDSTTGKITEALDKVDKALALSKLLTDKLNEAVSGDLEKLRRELTKYVNDEIEKLKQANKAMSDNLTNLLNQLRQQIQNDISAELEKLRRKDSNHDDEIAKLKTQITTGLATVSADANRSINALRTDATNRMNAIVNNMVVKTGAAKQDIAGELTATRFTSSYIGNENAHMEFTNQSGQKQQKTLVGTKSVMTVRENDVVVNGSIASNNGVLALRHTETDFTGFKLGFSNNIDVIKSGLHPVTKAGNAQYADMTANDFISHVNNRRLSKAVSLDGDLMNGPLGHVSMNLASIDPSREEWNWTGFRYTGWRSENNIAHLPNEILVAPERGQRKNGSMLGFYNITRRNGYHTRAYLSHYNGASQHVGRTELLTSQQVSDDIHAGHSSLFDDNEWKYVIPTTKAVKDYVTRELTGVQKNINLKRLDGIVTVDVPKTNNTGITITRERTTPEYKTSPQVGMSLGVGYGDWGGIYHGFKWWSVPPKKEGEQPSFGLVNYIRIESHPAQGVSEAPNPNNITGPAYLEVDPNTVWHPKLGDFSKFLKWDNVYHWSENKQRIGDVVNKVVKVDGAGHMSIGNGIIFRAGSDAPADQADKRISIFYTYDNAHGGVGLYVGGFMNVHHLGLRSDLRSKEHLKLIDKPLDKLKYIHGYTYKMKGDDDGRRAGVIAQEVEKVLPEVVTRDENDLLSVDYSGLVGLLTEAVKALKEENEVLKMEVRNLRSSIQSLSREIAEDRKRW